MDCRGVCKIGRRGDRGSAGVSDLAHILLIPPSANDADNGADARASSGGGVLCENELENMPDWAEVGGRSGEWFATTLLLDLRANGPGTEGRPENEADNGDGRLGDEANAALGDFPNPADPAPSPADGGPNGSRMGEEGCRRCIPPVTGGDWIEDDRADLMGTGDANESPVSGDEPRGKVGRGLSSGLDPPPSLSRCCSRCCSFLFLRSILIGSPGRTWARAPDRQLRLRSFHL